MQQTELDWEARRDQGIQSSAQHAEADVPGWGEMAVEATVKAVAMQTGHFTMEHIRDVAHFYLGLPIPAELRSWGSVTQKAIRQGIIRKTGGYAPAQSSNGSPKPLYVGCV